MTLKKDGITLVDSGGGGGTTIILTDGANPTIQATVFDRPNSNPLAVELVDINGDPIVGTGGGPATIADGADVTEGSIADVAVSGDNPGTLSAKLRGLNAAIAAGISITAVDLDIRDLVFATDKVDISGSTLGANSGVDIGDVTINNGPGVAAVNVQGAVIISGGVKGTTPTAQLTSSNEGLNHQALDVVLYRNSLEFGTSGNPIVVSNNGTQTFQGNKTHNNAPPDITNIGVLPALANAIAPLYTEGNLVLLSTDLTGALRITGAISATSAATASLDNPTYTESQVAALSQDTSGNLRVRSAPNDTDLDFFGDSDPYGNADMFGVLAKSPYETFPLGRGLYG